MLSAYFLPPLLLFRGFPALGSRFPAPARKNANEVLSTGFSTHAANIVDCAVFSATDMWKRTLR